MLISRMANADIQISHRLILLFLCPHVRISCVRVTLTGTTFADGADISIPQAFGSAQN